MGKKQKGQKNPLGEITRDYTVNLHKRVHRITFKKKAPRAVRELVKFAQQNMLTKDVRVDPRLNEYLWSQGIRNLPRKVRVRLSRKKKEEDDGKGKFYTFVQHVDVESFAELKTERVKNSD